MSDDRQPGNTIANPASGISLEREQAKNRNVTSMESEPADERSGEAMEGCVENGGGYKTPSGGMASGMCSEQPTIAGTDYFQDNEHHCQEVSAAGEDAGMKNVMSDEELKLVNRYLNEPMVVQEATDHALPQTLILACSVNKPQTPSGGLVTVVDLLMAELGYRRNTDAVSPVDWDLTAGSAILDYSYSPLDGVKFQLLFVPMHGILVVHGLVRFSDDIIQKRARLQIKTSEVVSTAEDKSLKYHGVRLSQLSRCFKDTVAYPLLQFAKRDNDELFLPTLTSLFCELKVHVMRYLNARSLIQLSGVNKEFRCVARLPILWRRLYVKDFGRRTEMGIDQDWLAVYKEAHGKRKRVRRRPMTWDCLPPVFPFVGPTYPDCPPLFPSMPSSFIVGGEYDLRPNLAPDPLHLPDPLRLTHNLAPDSLFDPRSVLDDQLPAVLPAQPPASSLFIDPGRRHPPSAGFRFH